MIQPDELFRHMRDFNQRACEHVLESMNIIEDQTEKMMSFCIDQAVGMPEQGKNAARMMVAMYRTGFDTCKKLMEYTCRNGMSSQENLQKSE